MASVFPTPRHTTFNSNLSISELGRFTKERSQFEDSPYYSEYSLTDSEHTKRNVFIELHLENIPRKKSSFI